ncbi:MAG: SGNH/GDSL hydrolase family protein [Lentisphaeria bacterium]|nr:SGNH/GDSL hydrolase family protein [Lentisphaeria bacterium]
MKKNFLYAFFIAFSAVALQAAPAATPVTAKVPVPPFLKMALPEVIYAVPGIETNIYFENVIDSATPEAYVFEVRCKAGAQKQYRWHWTPDEKDAGKTFDFELRLFNDLGLVLSGKSKIVVARKAPDMKKKITLALLAASGANSGYPGHLLKVMREAGFSGYTPVGSHSGAGKKVVPGGVAHDGYGGFAWNTFLTRWVFSEEEMKGVQDKAEIAQMKALSVKKIPLSNVYRYRSPLLSIKGGKKVLDIPAWLKKINNGKAPDFIIIQLGGNDVFGCRPEGLDSTIVKVMANARTLLAALRKHAPDAIIGVATNPCGCGQDGFGVNYGCSQSKYQYRRNIQRYNREIIQLVKKSGDPNIRIIPLHQSIDPRNSYIYAWPQVHARSKRKLRIDNNALHPPAEGGAQLGDAIYCWLRKQLEK